MPGLVSAGRATLSFARVDLDRVRLDVGRTVGGLIPLPTLAEKTDVVEEVEVSLDVFELLR